ncbi:MAG: HAD family phosphatase [Kiritimatiellae bacterium]|nr:HAD family phosphatase [Kiritimatiellia bacterium]
MAEFAVFFDFDGVIADSEPVHYRAFQRVLEPVGAGFSWAQYQTDYIGCDDRDVFRHAFARAGRPVQESEVRRWVAEKATVFERLVREAPPPLYPGVRPLLDSLRPSAIVGLCTGAMPSDLHAILDGTGLLNSFDVVVTAADVRAGKPDPEGYRLAQRRAAELAGVSALPGVAIEDTPAGIRAACDADLPVVAVATTHPPSALSGAVCVVRSLEEIDCEYLASLAQLP